MMYRYILLCLVLFTGFSVSSAQSINLFKPGSYSKILEQHQQPFLLVLWSLDCPPCYKELSVLSEMLQSQPQLDLILVSTDTSNDIDEIKKILSKYKLSHISTWVFADEMSQQLRYEIDPGWYGELPRSYLFDAQHNRQAISGILKPEILQHWKNLPGE